MKEDLRYRFAIVGCGRIAKRHAEQVTRVGTLVAVCDVIHERADVLARNYAAVAYYSVEELLASSTAFDIAVICTPNGLHAAHTIACLRHGVHVICEKPMAIKTSDCQAMIAASEEAGRNLFIVKQNRFNPPVVALKKKLQEGALGKIFSMQLNCFWNRGNAYYDDAWRGTKELDGGTLFTQFSHFIDLMYWMLGDVKSVQAYRQNYHHEGVIDFEDTGVAILQFASGAIGTLNYTVNSFEKNMEGSLTLFGEKGTVKIGGQYLNKLDYCSGIHLWVPEGEDKANDYGTYTGSMSNHDRVYDDVIKVLQSDGKMGTNAGEAWKTVEIVERIYGLGER